MRVREKDRIWYLSFWHKSCALCPVNWDKERNLLKYMTWIRISGLCNCCEDQRKCIVFGIHVGYCYFYDSHGKCCQRSNELILGWHLKCCEYLKLYCSLSSILIRVTRRHINLKSFQVHSTYDKPSGSI